MDQIRTGLNNEAVSTLMAEVEAELNSQPLLAELLSDGSSLHPICPVNILTILYHTYHTY